MRSIRKSCLLASQPRWRSLAALCLAFSLIATGVAPSQALAAKKEKQAKNNPREMQAREAFAASNYKEALDLYTRLYAEQLHPTYLRNIGRCYQNLNDPERAISSFREYLRKAKDVTPQERAEVEGFIYEMEAQQKKTAAAPEPAKPEPKPLPVPAPPVNPMPQPVALVQNPTPASISTPPAPFYQRAWFWGLVGGVVVAGTAGGLWAAGVFSPKSKNACPGNTTCLNP
jgi:tetratricopeptide (TPR) repeat protein